MKSLIILCALLAGCSTVPINDQILNANQGITAVIQSTDDALNAHMISPDAAQSVSTIAHQMNPLLDSARAANDAADVPGATRTMKLVNQLLAGLKAYVPPKESK